MTGTAKQANINKPQNDTSKETNSGKDPEMAKPKWMKFFSG